MTEGFDRQLTRLAVAELPPGWRDHEQALLDRVARGELTRKDALQMWSAGLGILAALAIGVVSTVDFKRIQPQRATFAAFSPTMPLSPAERLGRL